MKALMRSLLFVVPFFFVLSCIKKSHSTLQQAADVDLQKIENLIPPSGMVFYGNVDSREVELGIFVVEKSDRFHVDFSISNGNESAVARVFDVARGQLDAFIRGGETLRLGVQNSGSLFQGFSDVSLKVKKVSQLESLNIVKKSLLIQVCRLPSCDEIMLETPLYTGTFSSTRAQLRVGSYNVENLFDSIEAPNTYNEYQDGKSNWVRENLPSKKINSILRVIAMMGQPEILVFYELESGASQASQQLFEAMKSLGYVDFYVAPQPANQAVTSGVFSKFPIVGKGVVPEENAPEKRQQTWVDIGLPFEHTVRIYANHWLSKRGNNVDEQEKKRRATATALLTHVLETKQNNPLIDLILTGDFNTNYNDSALSNIESALEYTLGTTGNESSMLHNTQKFYDLWFEKSFEERGSSSYGGAQNTLDHMLLASTLYDTHGLQYLDNSFRVVGQRGVARLHLLNADGAPLRWLMTSSAELFNHLGVGYSDHLPLIADFLLHPKSEGGVVVKTPIVPSSQVEHETKREYVSTKFADCREPGEFVSLSDLENFDWSHPRILQHCIQLSDLAVPIFRNASGALAFRWKNKEFVIGFTRARGEECPVAKQRSSLPGVNSNCRYAEDFEWTAVGKTIKSIKGRMGWHEPRATPAILVEYPDVDLVLTGSTDLAAPLDPSLFPRCQKMEQALWKFSDLTVENMVSLRGKCLSFSRLKVKVNAIPNLQGMKGAVDVGSVLIDQKKVLVSVAVADVSRFTIGDNYISGYATLADRGGWRLLFVSEGAKTGSVEELKTL